MDAIRAGTVAMVRNDGSQSNETAFWKKFAGIHGEKGLTDKLIHLPNERQHSLLLFLVLLTFRDGIRIFLALCRRIERCPVGIPGNQNRKKSRPAKRYSIVISHCLLAAHHLLE